MKCFSDCPTGCARECGYVHQPHVQGWRPARTSRREWLLMLALFVVVVLVSLIPA